MSSSSPPNPAPLDPSPLGTKAYWDTIYINDLENHTSDPSDTGTIWFSDSLAQEKIVDYLSSLSPSLKTRFPLSTTTFLDLGTGNGELLFALREEGGFEGSMLGVDYSVQSVQLARRIAEEKGLDSNIAFKVWDILNGCGEEGAEQELGQWDIVLDKGTFDAVSLSGVAGAEERYVRRVEELVKKEGLVLVTSCNWTEAEIVHWFEAGGTLERTDSLQYPSFTFGGSTGQSISSICFRKR